MRSKLIFTLVLILSVQLGYAQLSRTHYIPPITAADNSNATPQNQYLHVSTPSLTPVIVTVTEIGGTTSVYDDVSNANPLEILIGSGANTSFVANVGTTGSKYSNKGYSIQSVQPVYVSVRLTAGNQNQAGSLVSKGLAGLGTTFRVGTFTNQKNFSSNNQDYLNFVSVMATENNTQVDFSDLEAGTIIENDTPLSVILNYGETYVIALNPAVTPANRDGLVGALVTSNKPIVVNCGSSNGSNSTGNGRDFGIDQIAPLQTIQIDGQSYSEYIFVRANGYDDIERPLIIAHLDNTEVYVNGDDLTGTLLTTLSAGEYISIDGSYFSTQSPNASNPGGNMYVWTSKTAFAYQGIGGANNEANQEMFFVPPINCRTPKTINNIPLIQKTGTGGVDFTGGISIVAEFGASILVNGAASTASPQAIDGNPNFVTYLISGLTGNVSISSNKQIYVSYYGANGVAALAGFYSGFIFKPEIRSSALTSEVTDICLPNIELDLSSLESFDSYQWFYNGLEISGANSETLIPEFAGFYQLAGVISNCDIVLSDNIPVSNCAGDFDTDGINNNIDSDNDNDGTLNSQESNCDLTFDLSSTSGQFFTASSSASLENNLSTPFIGTEDQSMWFQAAPATETTISSTSYGLNFDLPTSYIIKQSESGTFPGSSDFDDLESFILSVPFEETLTVYDPDNQLLIDTNYDGVYDNNIEEFTAFEIRFKINSAFLASEDVTFSFHSFQSTGFSLEYFNNSLTEINSVAFQLVQTCRLTDTDGDLIFDSLDLDSDNDGIFDVIENGNSSLDQDQNGQIDEVESNDINNDGRHDFAVNPVDFDGDSILDYLDLDSDNDGLYDLFEAGIGVDAQDIDNDGQIDLGFSDTNMNGASDVSEAITPIDSDANGIPDYIQLDSDSDGCFDSNEAGFTATLGTLDGIAFDNYGLITGGDGYDFAIDSNSDGLFDYQEYVNIIPLDISSPIIICEFDNTSISVSLDSDSSSFDSVQWEQSLDGGASWIDVAEDFNSFEGQNSSDLQILNASISISNTIFRSRLERIDYVCGPIYSNEVTIIVNTTPTANAVLDIAICDDDNDGVNSFDFIADVTPTVLGTQDPLGFSVTYHPTQEDADLNTNAYVIPYSNVLTQESVFVRIENVNNVTCYDTTSFVIEVFDTPVIAAINDLQNCDDGTDGDLTNGQTETDLSALTAVVLGAQDTTLFNVSYHLDTTDANAGANALPLIYYNTTAFNQTLFVRIENTTNTNCYITEQFNIIVNTTPTANSVEDIAICDDNNDGVNSFDFIADVTPTVLGTQDPLGFSVTYHPTQEDADLNTNAYVIPYSNVLTQESVFVRIENVNNVTCYDTTSFVIEVFDTPVIAAINDLQNCDDGTDGDLTNGQTETDLSALTAVVLGAQDTTLFNVSYHLDTTDANAGANALPLIYYNTTAFNQTLFVRIENTTNTNCYITEQFNIIVNTTPTANVVLDIAICDDNNDGVNSFDFIADVTPTVLGTQDPLGFSVTYHPTQEDADLNTNAYVIPYSNVLTQESVFVRIENVNNVTCYDTTSFVIEVFDTPVPPVDFEYYQCDYTNSGDLTEVFDLVALNADIINGQDLTITHYETEADAEAGTNPIVGLYTNTSPVQTIYVLLVSNILSDCTAVGSYTIGVDPLPNVIVDVPLVQCDIDDVQDGISIYNLEEVGENVIIGDDASNYSLTFHLSQADLDAGINAIPNPTSYVNLTPLQTIYTRVENIATTCYTTSFFFLETIFNPIPDDAGLIVCDNSEGNGNDYDGLGLFTLSDANDYILSLIVANPDNDITSPDQLTIAYYTSETNALLELDQLPNEYISEVADAQTLFLRVERDNDCFGINSMLLQVLPVPTYDEVPDEILCTYTPGFIEVDFVADYNPIILGSQAASEVIITYHTSQEDADTGVNALPNPYTVVEQITVFVREEVQNNDPLVTACFISNVSFTLTVEPRPEFVAPIPLIVCDDDDVLDGLTTIDISVQTETIMAGFEDNVVTYHVSEDDANAGENPLDLLYTTIVPDLQTIFVRIEDDMTAITGCYSITPYDLVVVRPPAATTPESYEYCDPDADGFGVFNLSSLDPEITGTLSNLVISYHETQSDAFNNINPIIGEYFNVVAYEQTIFVRIQDTTITTDCFSYVDFSIIVNDVPQIELTPDTLEVCDDDFDGFGLFDLSLANEQILNGLDPLEFEVTYYETPENAETATNPIATPFSYTNLNPTNHEVYVRVENIITGCYNAVPLPLLVNPLPTIVLPTPLAICDDLLADSFTAFDLTVKNTEITLGDGSLEVVYYTSLLDAESANNAILDPTSYTNQAIDGAAPNPQTLHVRVTDLDTGCYDLTTLTIRVLPNPTPSPDPVDLELCDETSSGDGLEVFDLTTDEVFILNGELGVSASYYQTLEDAEAGENAIATPQAYTNIETPAQLIYVRVTNDLTGCYTLVDFNIIVHPLPQANVVSDLIACELDTDDVFDFDLESQTDLILGGQDPSLFEVTYHTSLLDAETGLNFLGSPYTNISDPEVIFVSVVNTDTGCRNTQLQFNLEVHEAAQAFAPLEFYVLCDDNVETDGDPSNDSVEFDLSVQDAFVLDGQDPLNYTVSYYASQSDADQGINALPMLYQNTVNPQVIIARVDNDIEVLDDTGALVDSSICYATALLTLNVDPLPIVLIDMDYILCVDTNGTEVLSPLEIETGLSSEDYTFIWSDATGVVVGTGSSYAPSQGGTYSLEVFDATLQTQCAAPVEVFTVIESTPPILTAQVTTAAFASTHVIEALATGQGVYEYSLDQGPWGDSGVFVDVTPGEHVVTARDLNGCGETQVVVYVIDYPLYFTPNGDGYNDTWNIVGVANQNNAKILIFDRFGKLLKQISPSGEGWDGTYNGAQLPSSDYWFTLDYTDPTTGNPQVLRAHFALKR